MTATITAPTTVATSISVRTNRKLWRTGAVAGVVAAGATAAYAGIVSAAGVLPWPDCRRAPAWLRSLRQKGEREKWT